MRQPFCEAARLRLGWSSAGVEGALREGMQLGGVGGEMVRDGEVGDFFEVDGLEVGHLHGRSGGINRGARAGQELYRCRCSRTPPPPPTGKRGVNGGRGCKLVLFSPTRVLFRSRKQAIRGSGRLDKVRVVSSCVQRWVGAGWPSIVLN